MMEQNINLTYCMSWKWEEKEAGTMEIGIEVLQKTKMELLCDPTVPLLGIEIKVGML
jgi:hypothetical protein